MKLNLNIGIIEPKTEEEVRTMRLGGLIWQAIKNYLLDTVSIGMKFSEIEVLVKEQFQKYGVESLFDKKGKFPSVVCLSLNHCVVHGVGSDGVIQAGDKLTIDLGFTFGGLNIDSAFSIIFEDDKSLAGKIRKKIDEYKYLDELTKALFYESIFSLKAGDTTGSITERMETFFKAYFPKKYSFLERFTGHGIGKQLHEFPRIYNFGLTKVEGVKLPAYSTICIEPMIIEQNDGSWVQEPGDNFGIYAKNKDAMTIHYEHLVLILEDGVEVLTASPQDLNSIRSTWELIKKI